MAAVWVILHLMLVLSDGIAAGEEAKDDGENRESRWSYTTQMIPVTTWDPLGCYWWEDFQCYDGRCISRYSVCDGLPDCSLTEDEDPEHCSYAFTPIPCIWETTPSPTDQTTDWGWWETTPGMEETNASCNFDSGDCGYSKESSGILQWIRHSGSTSSFNTGPSGDHTTGHGYYMYIETSTGSGGSGATARLLSPTVFDNGYYCLQFAYHMYGASINQLRVRVGSSLVWSRSYNQGNSWHLASVDVYIRNSQVVFEGVRGSSYTGDIAIDDVVLYPGTCPTDSPDSTTEVPTTAPSTWWWTTAWNNWWTPADHTDYYHSFQLRLRGGDYYSYGRVEVYYNGQWGTVCGDGFDWQEARVICRELGFPDYYNYYYNAYYGQGSGPIWMDNLDCSGYESSLQDCSRNNWGSHNCNHYDDVSVMCGYGTTAVPPLVWATDSGNDLDISSAISGSCDSDMMTVTFDQWAAPWLDGNLMHFADPTCKAFNNGSHLILATKLSDCGTTRNETDDYVIYSNKVLMYSSNHSVIIRDLQLEVPVNCKLLRKSMVSAQFTADSNAVKYNLEREGKFDIALQFYDSSSFYYAYTGPVGLQLNQMAYAQVRLSTDDNLRIMVDSCVATPSRNPADTVIYSLIENNCPEDPTVMTYYTSSPKVERFGFRAFQFATGQNKVFLHCLVQVCDGSDPNSRCTQGCMRRGDREKREATPSNQLRQVSAGPIFLRMPGDDEDVDFSAEKKTYTSSDFAQTPALAVAIAAVVGLAVVVLGIAAMAFVYKHRRDKMAFRYQPVDTAETY